MSRELLLFLDSLTLICAFIVVAMCAIIYQKVKGNGFLFMTMAFSWMLLTRIGWLISTFFVNAELKETLGSLVLIHWILIIFALIIFNRDLKRILK